MIDKNKLENFGIFLPNFWDADEAIKLILSTDSINVHEKFFTTNKIFKELMTYVMPDRDRKISYADFLKTAIKNMENFEKNKFQKVEEDLFPWDTADVKFARAERARVKVEQAAKFDPIIKGGIIAMLKFEKSASPEDLTSFKSYKAERDVIRAQELAHT